MKPESSETVGRVLKSSLMKGVKLLAHLAVGCRIVDVGHV